MRLPPGPSSDAASGDQRASRVSAVTVDTTCTAAGDEAAPNESVDETPRRRTRLLLPPPSVRWWRLETAAAAEVEEEE